jgi:uncharacterized membrane protein
VQIPPAGAQQSSALQRAVIALAVPTAIDKGRWMMQPYRWGKFQGWSLIVSGVILIVMMTTVLLIPSHHFAQRFLSGAGVEVKLPRYVESGNYAGIAGIYAVWMLMTFGTGTAILNKRGSTFVLVALLAIRSLRSLLAGSLLIIPLLFWVVSFYYYYKRRAEFRWP